MPTIDLNEINWLAVIVAALAAFLVGGIWYSALFGKVWAKAQGWTDEQVAAIKAQMSPPKFFGGMIVSYVVLALVLAVLVVKIDVTSALGGALLGGLVWLAVAAVTFTHHLASGKIINAFLIDAGCELIYLPVMGAIISIWR
jgi:hypothetical protein